MINATNEISILGPIGIPTEGKESIPSTLLQSKLLITPYFERTFGAVFGSTLVLINPTLFPMFKLSDVDRQVLSVAQADADLPYAEIAERLKLKQHTVRYTLAKLDDAGVIRRLTCVNLSRIGFGEYFLVLTLKNRTPVLQQRLVEAAQQSDHIVWLLELGGEYHLGVVFLASSLVDASLFIEQLIERSGVEVSQRILSLRVSRSYFGVKHLSPVKEQKRLNMGAIGTEHVAWEPLDHEILKLLSSNSATSSSALAKQLGKPESTIHYRIKQLKARGILYNAVYYVSPESYGMSAYRLHISAATPSQRLRDAFHDWARVHPNILAAFHTLGPWDFELRVEVQDFRQAMQLSQEISEQFHPQINRVEVIPAFAVQPLCHYPFRRWPTPGELFITPMKPQHPSKAQR